MKKRAKRYDSGGATEGPNANIDDDTRARALAWLQAQQERGAPGSSETVVPVRRRVAAPAAIPAAAPVAARGMTPEIAAAMQSGEIPVGPSQSAPLTVADRVRQAARNAMPGNSPLDSLGAAMPAAGAVGRAVGSGLGKLASAGRRGFQYGRGEAAVARDALERRGAAAEMEAAMGREIAKREAAAAEKARWKAESAEEVWPGQYKKGGLVKKRRGDGIAQRGRTKGAMR